MSLEQVGIHDNFFHLGGNSIKTISVVAKAQGKSLSLNVKDIFDNPTIEKLAANIGVSEVGFREKLDSLKQKISKKKPDKFLQAYAKEGKLAHKKSTQLIRNLENVDLTQTVSSEMVLVTGGTGHLGANLDA